MPSYFRQVPDFEYVSRLPNAKIGDFINVKNLFKKGKLREDIFQDLTFFTKYQIKGDDRPDNVAYEIYGDSTLDWVILLSNNVLNVQSEWPLSQKDFDSYLLGKYALPTDTETQTYDRIYNGVHHYETIEVVSNLGVTILQAGLQVPSNFSISYFDDILGNQVTRTDVIIPITNYEYEEKIENDKRNIFILKKDYLGIVLNDMEEIMQYKEGSSQYKTETLKTADNIRLYQ
jgi:hypothetical protein